MAGRKQLKRSLRAKKEVGSQVRVTISAANLRWLESKGQLKTKLTGRELTSRVNDALNIARAIEETANNTVVAAATSGAVEASVSSALIAKDLTRIVRQEMRRVTPNVGPSQLHRMKAWLETQDSLEENRFGAAFLRMLVDFLKTEAKG